MVAKKRASKRVTLQRKYKVIKRAKEHHRKIKKGIIVGNRKKKQASDSIPNDWPYKEQLLKDIQTAKLRMEEMKQRQKEKRHEEISKRRKGLMDTDKPISTDKGNTLSAPVPMEFEEEVQAEEGISMATNRSKVSFYLYCL